ncbi:DNA-binding MurR/RpiR family transcriptional regulator [Alkalihalobacillus xiaoxiensis]|uniref:DNA-binding MurR/RpiR family transcriptional regulator n=1 Tax=Shouchella xiaoxiensis TaxID=766895 RepID=A0ABS2STD7_9BACI|nr:DNA-binding MurR/RpiR family transcriptional regulator [Shouchella xiaoxiensis]
MITFEERIESKKKSLTATEEKIIIQLKSHEKPFLLSMNELAFLSEVSEPSVVRLYKKLGYSSYQELKVALAQELAEMKPSSSQAIDIAPSDSVDVVFEKIGDQFFQAMSLTKDQLQIDQVELAVKRMQQSKRLYFFGQGLSGTVAEDGAHKFMRLGGMTLSVKDPHYQAIYASHMNDGDMVIAISHSGETIDIINVCELAKQSGAFVLVITSNQMATLAQCADICLITQAHETSRQSDAMISRLVQLALLDTLYTRVASEAGGIGKTNINRSRLAVTRMKK